MRIFKYFVLITHLLAVIIVGAFFLNTDHILLGQGFPKCIRDNDVFYLMEKADSYSGLYRGDTLGNVSHIFLSNNEESGVLIENFTMDDEIYVLLKHKNGYSIRKLNKNDLTTISKSSVFNLKDIEEITDFEVRLSDNTAGITAISDGRMMAFYYDYSLSEMIPVEQEQKGSDNETDINAISPTYTYTSVNNVITTGYFDGNSFVSGGIKPVANAVDPYVYQSVIDLSFGQSLKINIPVFLMFLAYGIIGVIVIILIVSLMERRRRFIDHILANEVLILGIMCSIVFLFDNISVALIWTGVASLLNVIFVLLQNRDILVLCKNMGNISMGNFSLIKPSGTSRETLTLWRGMNEIKYLYENYKYYQDATMAAALRFLPNNLGNMFKVNSLDELRPGECVVIPGTWMSLKVGEHITDDMVSLIENYEKKSNGTLITGECSSSEIKMLFSNPNSDEVINGLEFYSLYEDKSACSLYFKDDFEISIVGTQSKSILNITSKLMDTMNEFSGWFFKMGIRMVVSEDVLSEGGVNSPLRTIGYAVIDGEKRYFHEVLNAYDESIRTVRLNNIGDFNNAMELFYQGNYYLARTGFSDILKVDPKDELSRWYLFICEKYLNNPEITEKSCALDPRN